MKETALISILDFKSIEAIPNVSLKTSIDADYTPLISLLLIYNELLTIENLIPSKREKV